MWNTSEKKQLPSPFCFSEATACFWHVYISSLTMCPCWSVFAFNALWHQQEVWGCVVIPFNSVIAFALKAHLTSLKHIMRWSNKNVLLWKFLHVLQILNDDSKCLLHTFSCCGPWKISFLDKTELACQGRDSQKAPSHELKSYSSFLHCCFPCCSVSGANNKQSIK